MLILYVLPVDGDTSADEYRKGVKSLRISIIREFGVAASLDASDKELI